MHRRKSCAEVRTFFRSPKRLATHKSHRKVYYENDEQTDGRTVN